MNLFTDSLYMPGEIQAMANLWQVANLLNQGITYSLASMMTSVSIETLTLVARFLSHEGSGYKKYLNK